MSKSSMHPHLQFKSSRGCPKVEDRHCALDLLQKSCTSWCTFTVMDQELHHMLGPLSLPTHPCYKQHLQRTAADKVAGYRLARSRNKQKGTRGSMLLQKANRVLSMLQTSRASMSSRGDSLAPALQHDVSRKGSMAFLPPNLDVNALRQWLVRAIETCTEALVSFACQDSRFVRQIRRQPAHDQPHAVIICCQGDIDREEAS